MAKNDAESYSKSRMPDRPAEIMADKSKGTRSKMPPLSGYSGHHIPTMGEGVTAAKPGPKVDGLGKMAVRSMESRNPVTAESFSKRKGS